MRSAGYHVRVVAQEDLGWEEDPPTLLEFMRRDLRWCQGNMQYFRLLSLANLKPVSRYQLMLAIVMFIDSPAWIGLLLLATVMLASFDSPARFIRSDVGIMLFAWVLVMWFAPKIASFIDLLLRPDCCRAFGGAIRIVVNFVIETVYSIVLCPILLDQPHHLSRRPAFRSRDRLDRASTRRPRCILQVGTLQLVAADPHRMDRHRPGIGNAAGGAAICSFSRRRAGPCGAVRDGDSMGSAWQACHCHWHWPAAGGDCDTGGIAAVVVARHPAGGPARLGVAVLDAVRTVRATVRSLRIYYGNRARAAAMDRLYGVFIQPGDLVFDVGAHVGDRVASFRRLGARVVAVEPQHAMARVLRPLVPLHRAGGDGGRAGGSGAGQGRQVITSDTPPG